MYVRRLVRHTKVPKIKELDTPVSFYTGTATPDADRGFDIKLTPLMERWAKVDWSAGAYTGGSPDQYGEDRIAHALTVRYEDQEIPRDAYLILDDLVCRVVQMSPLGVRKEFVLVYAVEIAAMKDADVTILASADDPTGTESETEPDVDDLWSDGF